MKAVESEGKSVEEAVSRALLLLGLDQSEVEVEVVSEAGSANAGGGMARVRVVPKSVRAEPDAHAAAASPEATTGPREHVSRETPPAGPRSGDVNAHEALELLRALLGHMGVNCSASEAGETEDGRLVIEISGPDCGIAIGRQGQTLDAIELILNRMLSQARPDAGRVGLDAEGYRARRSEKLIHIALDEAARVARGKLAVALEPMSPRDRRTIHMALSDRDDVRTRSEGDGPERHVIIEPTRR